MSYLKKSVRIGVERFCLFEVGVIYKVVKLHLDKIKSQEWLRSVGLQLPRLNTILDSNATLLQNMHIVNSYRFVFKNAVY